MMPYAQRRDRLIGCLAEEQLDALLISHPANVTYLTGFSGDSSLLVLTRHRAILVSDPRYVGQIADECGDLETYIRPPTQKVQEAAADLLGKLAVRTIGCESAALTLAEAELLRTAGPTFDWKPGSDRVERLRMVKDAGEIAAIREAIGVAERAFAAFVALLRPEDCEKDLADAMEGFIRRCGGLGAAFPPIIGVGERAALPHCPPTSKRVEQADLLLVDWGAIGKGHYRSDLTRVLATHRVASSGSADRDRLTHIHAIVLQAQQAALRAVRPGAVCKDIDAAARSVIAEAGHAEHFGHGLGHGIGLQIHEGPAVRPGSETVLEVGMVFTLEPGIYLPGWGGVRIEDDVLVTPDGAEVLTHVERDLSRLSVFV
jgi:Xaa-Pro aminopeptidase